MFYVFYLVRRWQIDARSVSLKQGSVVSRETSIQAGKETVASISVWSFLKVAYHVIKRKDLETC